MKKVYALVMIVSILAALLSGCSLKSDEELIKDRMQAFLAAYNSGDMDEVLECLDSKTRNTYEAAMNITGGLIGLTGFEVSISDLFGLGVGLMSDGDVLQLQDVEVSINSDKQATVSATMWYEDYETSYSKNVKFTLVKEDGNWYICG